MQIEGFRCWSGKGDSCGCESTDSDVDLGREGVASASRRIPVWLVVWAGLSSASVLLRFLMFLLGYSFSVLGLLYSVSESVPLSFFFVSFFFFHCFDS